MSVDKTNQYILANYGRFPISMTRGQGAQIWDETGKRYIDFFAGFGACGVTGHSHPEITKAVTAQVNELQCHGNYFTNPKQAQLAEKIIKHSFPGKVFFCHSGAEANEAAIKLIRKATGKQEIICFQNSFHGRSMGALSITPESFHKGFEPMLSGAVRAEYNNLESVKSKITDKTAGIFIEPIQGEGGLNLPSTEFMQGIRELCDKHNLLLVCDEVWTSPARIGKMFAYQLYGITPDAMTLAKAIGGSLPLGACVISDKYADVLGPGTHGCTMGGNPVCSAAALASMELIEEENLVEKAKELGEYIVANLKEKNLNKVKEIRHSGLMIGLELKSDYINSEIVKESLNQGLFVAGAKNNVLRIAPPIVIKKEILDEGLGILNKLLA